MSNTPSVKSSDFSLTSVPAFWPMAMGAAMLEEGRELYARNLKFVDEEIRIHDVLRPMLATPNRMRLDLRTMALRDYGEPKGIPTLVDAPHAGHTAVIADYHQGQSLIQTLLRNGIEHAVLTDWKSATDDMKDFDIDNYLADIVVAIDDLGGRVNLVGLCQGGWVSAMIAARFPDKVNSLVLAGAPIDTDAGNGPIKHMAKASPMSFYEELVELGGGVMKGKYMLQGWKNMHPEQHYIQDHIDLYEHIDDPAYSPEVRLRAVCVDAVPEPGGAHGHSFEGAAGAARRRAPHSHCAKAFRPALEGSGRSAPRRSRGRQSLRGRRARLLRASRAIRSRNRLAFPAASRRSSRASHCAVL